MPLDKVTMPVKKTYSTMKNYYKSANDRHNANIYGLLDNHAKARLHNRRSMLAQQKILDYSEEIGDEGLNFKEKINYTLAQFRNSFEALKEAALTVFYNCKNSFHI